MWQGRRWAGVVLSAAVASFMCLAASGPALAAAAGTEVLAWSVNGSIEAGGIYEFGENSSSKFDDYRDMESGFVGELSLRGEKKDSPYFFDLWLKNPARDDQAYEGEFGRYGMFQLEMGWNRVRHVLSNTATTMFQENPGGDFIIPASLRTAITRTPAGFLNGTAANCTGITNWTCPYPVGSSTVPTVNNPQFVFIRDTINGLSRPIDYAFNTDVGFAELRFTPREDLQFDFEYNNRRKDGYRSMSADLPNHPVELPIPIEDMTQEIKFKVEYARPEYAIQFGYMASLFDNELTSYKWDALDSTVTQLGLINLAGTTTRTPASARGELSAPPDNVAHTFNLTGRGSLPWWRTNVSGNFSYTMLRQDDTFINNFPVAGTGITPKNTDDAGRNSADAKTNLVLANILLTSRPVNSVSVTAKYRYYELQNDMPVHIFSDTISPVSPTGVLSQRASDGRFGFLTGGGTFIFAGGTSGQERFTKQNAGLELGWRTNPLVSLKAGYEYEHWNRGDFDGKDFSTDEHIAKASVDVTPTDWLLGRLTYTYGTRDLDDSYGQDPLSGPGFYKFNYADRDRNRVDLLLQLTRWETFTPSVNFGYADDNYSNSRFGLTDDENLSAGVGLGWTPMSRLTLSADYTYERHDTTQRSPGSATAGFSVNDFESRSKDEFHIFGLNAIVDVIPKVFDINLGYMVSFGNTKINAQNLYPNFTTLAGNFDDIENVLQTFSIVGRYFLTERLSVRAGFAYERYTEQNFAKDPMLPFMGYYDRSGGSILSNWVGATVPNYEAYITSFFVRYDF